MDDRTGASLHLESGGAHERTGRDAEVVRILVLCNYDPYNAATVCDHVNALFRYSKHQVTVVSNIGELPDWFSFEPFDAVVIHYSLFLALEVYVPTRVKVALRRFCGLKLLFVQDEYRFVDRTVAAVRYCGIDVIFTCVPTPEITKVYDPELLPDTECINVLTGYVPEALKVFQPKPLAERRYMVGYRGRVYPAWHGEAGREKHEIGRRFREDAKARGLRCDIAWDEESRVYGLDWVEFIRDCRAMLAVESGASVFDFDGTVSVRTETFAAVLGIDGRKQSSGVRRMLRGRGVFAREPHDRDLYERLREMFFADKEQLIDLAQVSPRVFEAATLRTMLIMYEGAYSGIFKPWRHYVPLRKDHGNMAEIVEVLSDPVACAKIISDCYAEVCQNHAYAFARLAELVDEVVERKLTPERRSSVVTFDRERILERFQSCYVPNPHALKMPRRRRALLRRVLGAVARLPGVKLVLRGL